MPDSVELQAVLSNTNQKLSAIREATDLPQVVRALGAQYSFGGEDSLPIVQPFEENLRKFLQKNQVPSGIYNRFEYSGLLNTGLEYLTRAMALRDDGQELSLRAFNSSLERWKTEQEIELAQNQIDDAGGEYYAQEALAKAMSNIEGDMMRFVRPIDKHTELDQVRFQKEYQEIQARHAGAVSAMDAVSAKQLTAQKRLQTMQVLNAALKKRDEMPGHAMNFRERIANTKLAFLQNMTEAYSCLLAAYEGISVVLPTMNDASDAALRLAPFPNLLSKDLNEIGYVDVLMRWARATLFALDRVQAFTHEYRMLLSMTALGKQPSAKLSAANGRFIFNLNKEELPEFNNPRILHLAVHVMPSPPKLSDLKEPDRFRAQHGSYSGTVRLPQQNAVPGSGTVPALPRYYFGDATVYGEDTGKHLSSVAFRNANPIGEWVITISGQSRADIAANPPDDVWLELVVAGTRTVG